jgi:hypothetical protein
MVLNLIFPNYHKLGYTDPVSDKPIVGVALNKLQYVFLQFFFGRNTSLFLFCLAETFSASSETLTATRI